MPAKINWSLSITGKKADGYHELDMLMQTVSLYDTLDISKSDSSAFECLGSDFTDTGHNLAWQALKAVSEYVGRELKTTVKLTKRIPSAAGLGGGSSDCAGVLLALNKLYDLNLKRDELNSIAVKLGADVPFFLEGGFCRVRGIGELTERLAGSFGYPLLIVHCGQGLSTPEVYKRYDLLSNGCILSPELGTDEILSVLRSGSAEKLKGFKLNQLETPAANMLREIDEVKCRLYGLSAVFAQMSGSGSAVYGVFTTKRAALKAAASFRSAYVCETML